VFHSVTNVALLRKYFLGSICDRKKYFFSMLVKKAYITVITKDLKTL
jgi:hypothetical protein